MEIGRFRVAKKPYRNAVRRVISGISHRNAGTAVNIQGPGPSPERQKCFFKATKRPNDTARRRTDARRARPRTKSGATQTCRLVVLSLGQKACRPGIAGAQAMEIGRFRVGKKPYRNAVRRVISGISHRNAGTAANIQDPGPSPERQKCFFKATKRRKDEKTKRHRPSPCRYQACEAPDQARGDREWFFQSDQTTNKILVQILQLFRFPD